jgi:hypothetical protein
MKSVAAIVLAVAFGTALLSPALAAKHAKATKMTGACVQQSGRCVSDCDQFNWCTMPMPIPSTVTSYAASGH